MRSNPSGFVGVLMLDTHFPRPPGDVGNAETYERHGIPVRFTVVEGASPLKVVQQADRSFVRPFVDAAKRMVHDGATMITTSCGFLASYQDVLAQAVAVPVLTSSLLACRHFAHPGIVTFDAASLTRPILDAAGVPAATPLQGLQPGCEMHRRILGNETEMDLTEASRNVVAAACALVRQAPAVQDIVLECTNMPPYRDAVIQATGRRVHDIETLVVAQWQSLANRL